MDYKDYYGVYPNNSSEGGKEMNEVKMVMPERIKLTVSDKKGNMFMSVGLEKDLPEGIGIEAVAEALYQKAAGFVQAKLAEVEISAPAPKQNYAPRSNGNACKTCGGQMVAGKNGKPYCVPCYIAWKESQKNNTDIPF